MSAIAAGDPLVPACGRTRNLVGMQWLAGIAHTHKHTVTQHTAPEQHTIHVDLLFWNSIVNVLVKVVLSAVGGVLGRRVGAVRVEDG